MIRLRLPQAIGETRAQSLTIRPPEAQLWARARPEIERNLLLRDQPYHRILVQMRRGREAVARKQSLLPANLLKTMEFPRHIIVMELT
jgi:hypothetical protein